MDLTIVHVIEVHRVFKKKYRTLQSKSKQQNFRKWFKYGLKAQKLLAQGIALGILAVNKAPCKGKSIVICLEF